MGIRVPGRQWARPGRDREAAWALRLSLEPAVSWRLLGHQAGLLHVLWLVLLLSVPGAPTIVQGPAVGPSAASHSAWWWGTVMQAATQGKYTCPYSKTGQQPPAGLTPGCLLWVKDKIVFYLFIFLSLEKLR